MFESGMKETVEKVITLSGISGATLKSLIHFMYTAEIDLDEENVEEIIVASLFLQMDALTDYCSEFMAQKISIYNCCFLAIFAEQHHIRKLLELSADFLLTNFELIYKQPEFNKVPATFLRKILWKDDLTVYSETSIFNAIEKWFLHDPIGRSSNLADILKSIRFESLPPKVQLQSSSLINPQSF